MSDSRLAALTINDSSIAAISSSTRTGTKIDGRFVPCRPSKHIVSWLIEHIDSEHGIEHEAYTELVEFRLVGKLRWYSHLLYVGILTMRLTHGITFKLMSPLWAVDGSIAGQSYSSPTGHTKSPSLLMLLIPFLSVTLLPPMQINLSVPTKVYYFQYSSRLFILDAKLCREYEPHNLDNR